MSDKEGEWTEFTPTMTDKNGERKQYPAWYKRDGEKISFSFRAPGSPTPALWKNLFWKLAGLIGSLVDRLKRRR